MLKVVGLDIGSGFTKCFDGERRLIFPSVYAYRQPSLWEDSASTVEGVGEEALKIARYPGAVTLYPVIDGRPQHQAFLKLAEEALRRLETRFYSKVFLVSGLPYETGRDERETIKQQIRNRLEVDGLAVYPQSLGTLFDLDLKSGTVINIGHGTTEILVVEDLNVLGGTSDPLASDYIIQTLTNHIQGKHGFKPTTENILDLITGKTSEITAFEKPTVRRVEVEDRIETAVEHLAEKICYETRLILTQLPPNLKCTANIVLSGGGSLITGVKEKIAEMLGVEVKTPSNPIFSNVHGFYKMGMKLHG